MFKGSWKTTSAGITAITASLITLTFAIINKTITAELITGVIAGILTGVGLMLAKDSNVTGGNVSNNLNLKA